MPTVKGRRLDGADTAACGVRGGIGVAVATGMMRIIVALVLMASVARAGESDTHDGGWDAGGTAAFVGGMTVLSL